jgi:hypothetical protein
MDRNIQELLAGFHVRENWQARAQEYQRLAKTAFSVAVLAVFSFVLILGFYRWRFAQNRSELFVLVQTTWFFLFAVGSWCITRAANRRLPRYLWIAFIASLILLALFLTQRAEIMPRLDQPADWAYMLIILIPLIVIWIGTGSSALVDCRTSSFCLLSTTWRLRALFYGTCVGVVLMFQQLLAAAFSGLPWLSLQPEPLYLFQWSTTAILVRPIAEEFIFRATIFDYLHKVRQVDLWIALVISTLFNVLIYLPQLPAALQADQIALFLLAPTMLAITNALLWTWERGPNACVASNFTFCVLRVLLQ